MENFKIRVNNVFRLITYESRVILLDWLLKNSQDSFQTSIIKERILDNFKIDDKYQHFFDANSIKQYLSRTLSDQVLKSLGDNVKSGKKKVQNYKINVNKVPENIEKIIAHSIYASASFSQMEIPISLSDILYGDPWKKGTGTGSQGHIALLLNQLNESMPEGIQVNELENKLGFCLHQTMNHLDVMDKKGWLRHDRIGTKASFHYLGDVCEGGGDQVFKSHIGKDKHTTKFKIVLNTVFDLIKTKRIVTLDDVKNDVQQNYPIEINLNSAYKSASNAFKYLCDIGLVQKYKLGEHTPPIILLDRGIEITETFINPIMSAIEGDTSLLKEPTEEMYNQALENCFRYREIKKLAMSNQN